MYTNNPLGPNYNEGMVDRLLGKAYLTIKKVHDNLELIVNAENITEDNKAVKEAVDKLNEFLESFTTGSGLFIGHDLGEVGVNPEEGTYIGDNFLTSLAKSIDYLEPVGKDLSNIDLLAVHINELKAIAAALNDILDIKPTAEEAAKVAPYITNVQIVSKNTVAIQNVASNEAMLQAINNSLAELKNLYENIGNISTIINSLSSVAKVAQYISLVIVCAENINTYMQANELLTQAQAVIKDPSLKAVVEISEPIKTVSENVSPIASVDENISTIKTVSSHLTSIDTVAENISSIADTADSVGWFPLFSTTADIRCKGITHKVDKIYDPYTWTALENCWITLEGIAGNTSEKKSSVYCSVVHGIEVCFTGTGTNKGDNLFIYGTCFMPKGSQLKIVMSGLSWLNILHTAVYKNESTRPAGDTPSTN